MTKRDYTSSSVPMKVSWSLPPIQMVLSRNSITFAYAGPSNVSLNRPISMRPPQNNEQAPRSRAPRR